MQCGRIGPVLLLKQPGSVTEPGWMWQRPGQLRVGSVVWGQTLRLCGVHWGRRGRSEEARIQRLTFLSQQLTLEKRREKINANQTVRDAALHGWIRVTVGLSPWEHYSAINKKINKPFIYLFSLPSPSPLISPLLLQGALLPSVSFAEGVFGRSRSRKDKNQGWRECGKEESGQKLF